MKPSQNNFLIDTCVLIVALHGYQPAIDFIDNLKLVTVSVVTQAELLEGCRNKRELEKIKKLIQGFRVIYPTKKTFSTALEILEKHYLKYGILFEDALLAATALEQKKTLVTTEKKHFSPIKNLQLLHLY